MSGWTPELRKQLRKVCPSWKISGPLADPEVQAEAYAHWRAQQGLHDTPVAVFPEGKTVRSPSTRARAGLRQILPAVQFIEVDPEEYKGVKK